MELISIDKESEILPVETISRRIRNEVIRDTCKVI